MGSSLDQFRIENHSHYSHTALPHTPADPVDMRDHRAAPSLLYSSSWFSEDLRELRRQV